MYHRGIQRIRNAFIIIIIINIVKRLLGALNYYYKRKYLWWSLYTLYLFVCEVRVTIVDSGRCSCVCVTSFER